MYSLLTKVYLCILSFSIYIEYSTIYAEIQKRRKVDMKAMVYWLKTAVNKNFAET